MCCKNSLNVNEMYFPTHSCCIYHRIASIDHFKLLQHILSVALSLAVPTGCVGPGLCQDSVVSVCKWIICGAGGGGWALGTDWALSWREPDTLTRLATGREWCEAAPGTWRTSQCPGTHGNTQTKVSKSNRVNLNKLVHKMFATYLEFLWKRKCCALLRT